MKRATRDAQEREPKGSGLEVIYADRMSKKEWDDYRRYEIEVNRIRDNER